MENNAGAAEFEGHPDVQMAAHPEETAAEIGACNISVVIVCLQARVRELDV